MSYDPKAFWEQRLSEHFDLTGTGETGLSLAYNRACYALRAVQLERALGRAGARLAGAHVLDVGCGTGFFTDFYLRRGARVTGIDLATTSVERLRQRFPGSTFVLGDVSEAVPGGGYHLVNAFDVLYHITDSARWERAVRNLAASVAPGGWVVLTDVFDLGSLEAAHNVARPLSAYRTLLGEAGFEIVSRTPTHVLLNRHLGPFRFLNRAPGLLYAIDRAVLGAGLALRKGTNVILVARRAAAS